MIWIILILLAVFLISGAGRKDNGNRQTKPYRINHPHYISDDESEYSSCDVQYACRIDHPHYISNDESECSTCGARFPKRLSSCPRCGVTFDSVKKDEEEWYEEFDEECAWDEEEGW